jgi:hypothetical protein
MIAMLDVGCWMLDVGVRPVGMLDGLRTQPWESETVGRFEEMM